jgi:hypothetical protein
MNLPRRVPFLSFPFLSYPFLSLPFLSFPFPSFPACDTRGPPRRRLAGTQSHPVRRLIEKESEGVAIQCPPNYMQRRTLLRRVGDPKVAHKET